jgi:hypothetical protein
MLAAEEGDEEKLARTGTIQMVEVRLERARKALWRNSLSIGSHFTVWLTGQAPANHQGSGHDGHRGAAATWEVIQPATDLCFKGAGGTELGHMEMPLEP